MRDIIYVSKYKKIISIWVPIISLFFNSAFAMKVSGVLVASEDSQVQKVSIIEVRKIFIGLPASESSKIHQPVINNSDKQVYQIFLRKVLRMTDKGYKRKLIKRIFRQGSEKIKSLNKKDKLVQYLRDNPNDVSFMLKENAEKIKGIKVIQQLW